MMVRRPVQMIPRKPEGNPIEISMLLQQTDFQTMPHYDMND